jgi:hypothetical protein
MFYPPELPRLKGREALRTVLVTLEGRLAHPASVADPVRSHQSDFKLGWDRAHLETLFVPLEPSPLCPHN